jgi:hypothetical protein
MIDPGRRIIARADNPAGAGPGFDRVDSLVRLCGYSFGAAVRLIEQALATGKMFVVRIEPSE